MCLQSFAADYLWTLGDEARHVVHEPSLGQGNLASLQQLQRV